MIFELPFGFMDIFREPYLDTEIFQTKKIVANIDKNKVQSIALVQVFRNDWNSKWLLIFTVE